MRIRKYLISVTISLFIAPFVPAQVVVIDPAHIANNQANHLVDLAKYVEMVNNQLKQIITMTQELQQVTAYVKAFGDPSSLLNITGANQLISSLKQTGVGRDHRSAAAKQLTDFKRSNTRPMVYTQT
jgi:hypothetical protein